MYIPSSAQLPRAEQDEHNNSILNEAIVADVNKLSKQGAQVGDELRTKKP